MTPFYETKYFNYPNYYTGIRKASIVLKRINEVQDISDLDRRDFIGRCYFLKGYYYFQSLVSGKLLLRIRKYLINNIFRGQTPVHDLKCLHLQSVS